MSGGPTSEIGFKYQFPDDINVPVFFMITTAVRRTALPGHIRDKKSCLTTFDVPMASQTRFSYWQIAFLFFLLGFIRLPAVAIRHVPSTNFPAFSLSDGTIDGLLARSNFLTRQERICPDPGGESCSEDTCCPSGAFCQPGGLCCPDGDFTGCQGGDSCCAPDPGIFCCSDSPSGCCIEEGEEPPPPPTTKQVTRTATKTSTSRIAQTATKTTVSESVSESASISATAVEETATASFSLAPPPTPTDGHIEKAQVSFNYEDILQPRAKSKEQDVAVRKAAVDSLFENMCKGIEEFGDRDSQSIVLTHNPSSGKENRKEACGNVSCAAGQSCDEFPFASSAEGGLGAIANCIIALGNSIQGGFLRSLLSSAGIGDGDHYLLQLTNVNCQDFLPTSGRRDLDRRQQVPPTSGLTSQMQELDVTTFGALGANDAFDHGLYYIGDLTSGQYAVNISLTNGVVSAYYIIDYQGATYAASYFNASMTGAALDFTLPSDTTGVTLMLDSVLDFNVSGSMTKISGGSSGARQQASAQIWFMVLIGALGLVSNTLV